MSMMSSQARDICRSVYICKIFLFREAINQLKGHGNEEDFLGFLHKPLGPLHYISSRSDFSFKFSEILEIEKQLPDSLSLIAMSL